MNKGIKFVLSAIDKSKAVFDKYTKNAQNSANKAGRSYDKLSRKTKSMSQTTSAAFSKMRIVAAAAFAAIGGFIAKSIGNYRKQASAEAKLEQILKSTGYAIGQTSGELKKYAGELQNITGVGDEVIISTQAMLASFKQIQPDNFNRATVAVLDMGAAMKRTGADSAEVERTSIQVGKALNDPIKGLSALSRVGVTFNDQQKEQIRLMQENGNLAGAQAIILAELESEFGGVAAAMNKADGGFNDLKNTFGDLTEEVGKASIESNNFQDIIKSLTATMRELINNGSIGKWVDEISAKFKSAADNVKMFSSFVGGLFGGSGMMQSMNNAIDEQIEREVKREEQSLVKWADSGASKMKSETKNEPLDSETADIDTDVLKNAIVENSMPEVGLQLDPIKDDIAKLNWELEKGIDHRKKQKKLIEENIEAQKKLNEEKRKEAQLSKIQAADKSIDDATKLLDRLRLAKDEKKKLRDEEKQAARDQQKYLNMQKELERGGKLTQSQLRFFQKMALAERIKEKQAEREKLQKQMEQERINEQKKNWNKQFEILTQTKQLLEKNLQAAGG